MKKTKETKRIFLQKQKTLENVRKILKTEFIGIDKIIDEVIDNVSSWFFLSDIQEKPVVINLWGLTGVGKTSLVNRLVELIDSGNLFYRFDLGKKQGNFSFRDSFDSLCEKKGSSPVIIALDEIQHSRTVKGPFREEVGDDKNRMIWELIDSGEMQYIKWGRHLWSLEDTLRKLSFLYKAGVEVSKGIVVTGSDLYRREMGEYVTDSNFFKKKIDASEVSLLFVPKDLYEDIIEVAGENLKLNLLKDVENLFLSYSGYEIISFLEKVLKIGRKPIVKNFTKSLIFVLGNLDEAYTMSSNFSADMDADEFHESTLKITVPKIKQALKGYFRNEQIARLGNIHIIYPALSKNAYCKIIQIELDKLALNLFNEFGLRIEFDDSVHKIIYSEGVYPTQGVRPIFTSIHQIIKSKLSLFFSEIFLKNLNVNRIVFTVKEKALTCFYCNKEMKVYEKTLNIVTNLEDVRQSKKDDMQAITAVHESGHAVLSIVLLKTIPEAVFSVTSDSNASGFMYSKFAWKYIARKEIIPRVAMILGGYVAEEVIFGKENLTAGAESDIQKATGFLSEMYKNNGMGELPIFYSIPENANNNAYHKCEQIENQIRKAIEEAKQLAETSLRKERKLLLKLADFLSNNRMLKKEQISKIVNKTLVGDISFIEDGDSLFYRGRLKEEINKDGIFEPVLPHFDSMISLNKEKK